MLRTPSTTALLCFEASARLGSFTRAAKELCLTQSAVSRQLITLENRMGVKLFVRRRDALLLTDAGRYYLDEVTPALQRLEHATANVMALQGRGGALRLSVAGSLGTFWLIPRLPDFTRQHSEITLNFATRVGPADFTGGALHASLEFGDGTRAGLHNEFVLSMPLVPCASPAWVRQHGVRLSENTPREALIHHTTVPEAWHEWFAEGGMQLDPGGDGPRYDLMAMAMNAAIAGLGAVMLPGYMSADAIAAGRLRPLSRRVWQVPKGYYLVYPKASEDLNALQAFKTWLMEQAGDYHHATIGT